MNFDTLVTGEVSKVRENGANSGVGVLATYPYDDEGRRTLRLTSSSNGLLSSAGPATTESSFNAARAPGGAEGAPAQLLAGSAFFLRRFAGEGLAGFFSMSAFS